MQENIKQNNTKEWACRILLTLHLFTALTGYITYIQMRHQLNSPLIPKSTIDIISAPSFDLSLVLGGTLLFSMWLYFFKKRTACIIISGISLIGLFYNPFYFITSETIT